MPSKAKYKKSGGDKDSASKNTMNPPMPGGTELPGQTREPEERQAKAGTGQYGETGQAPLMKK